MVNVRTILDASVRVMNQEFFLDSPCSCWPWKEPLARLVCPGFDRSYPIILWNRHPLPERGTGCSDGNDICDVRYPDLLRTGYVKGFPTRFLCTWNRWWGLLSHDMNAAASAEGGSPWSILFSLSLPTCMAPEFVPAQIINLFWSLCGAFPALFRQRSASPREADFWHFSFSNSFCNTSVCLSRAIQI